MTYAEQLQTEEWQNKREEILNRDNYKCTFCGAKENLNVHHYYYMTNIKAWEYPNESLTTFCNRCHKQWHKIKLDIDKLLSVDVMELSLFCDIIKKMKILKPKQIALTYILFDDLFNYGYNFGLYEKR